MKKQVLFLLLVVPFLLPAQTDIEKLAASPRHQEWVEISYNDRTVHNFVVYPEVSEKTKVIIVIHENRGLNDWARVFTDELAEKGYITIAPDLLSESGENIQKTSDYESPDKARESLYTLEPEQITADLDAVFAYAKSLAAGNGEVSVVGFCWGGAQSFRYAGNNDELKEAVVFYGTAPTEEAALQRIKVPVYGFYGGNDARVNATIESTAAVMKDAGNPFEYKIYEGGGHGYMRSGSQPDASTENQNARAASWEWLLEILRD